MRVYSCSYTVMAIDAKQNLLGFQITIVMIFSLIPQNWHKFQAVQAISVVEEGQVQAAAAIAGEQVLDDIDDILLCKRMKSILSNLQITISLIPQNDFSYRLIKPLLPSRKGRSKPPLRSRKNSIVSCVWKIDVRVIDLGHQDSKMSLRAEQLRIRM